LVLMTDTPDECSQSHLSSIQIQQEACLMYISLETSRTSGFRKWADLHQPISSKLARRTPPASANQDADNAVKAPPAPLHRPWLIPGVGSAF
jgi:hypothetical protein